MSLFDGSTLLGTTPMAGESATFSTSGMAAGEHVIIARFDRASGATISTEMQQTVRAATPTATPSATQTATATKAATPTRTETATATRTSLPRTGAGNLLSALALGLLLISAGGLLRTPARTRS